MKIHSATWGYECLINRVVLEILLRYFKALSLATPYSVAYQSQSHNTTEGQSVIMSRYRAHRYYFLSEGCFLKFAVLSLCGSLCDERLGLSCLSQSSNLPLFTSNIYVTCGLQFSNLCTINIKLQSVSSEYSRLCSTIISSDIPAGV
jgi:hypothetical protein